MRVLLQMGYCGLASIAYLVSTQSGYPLTARRAMYSLIGITSAVLPAKHYLRELETLGLLWTSGYTCGPVWQFWPILNFKARN